MLNLKRKGFTLIELLAVIVILAIIILIAYPIVTNTISQAASIRPIGLMPTVIDIINENGNTGIGSYPVLRIWLKPKKSEFRGIIFTSNTDSKGNDGLNIYELRNFDMSITPTN